MTNRLEKAVRNSEIIQLSLRGMEQKAIGKKFNLTNERVRQIICSSTGMSKTNLKHQTIIKEILDLIKREEDPTQIYKTYPRTTVTYVLRKYFKLTLFQLKLEKKTQKIILLYRKGKNIKEIAEELNLSYPTVSDVLVKTGERATRSLIQKRNFSLLKEYYSTNKTKRQIEREFVVSRNTVFCLQQVELYKNDPELKALRELYKK